MSETVHYIGKVKEVPLTLTLSFTVMGLVHEYNPKYKFIDEDNLYDYFADEFHDTHIIVKDKLYQILEKEGGSVEKDIINARDNEDGTIGFELLYYNGGAGFIDCLEEALKNIK